MVLASIVALLAGISSAQPTIDLDASERAAVGVVEEFFAAFNAADNVRLAELLNYPHVFLLGEGTLRTALTPGDADTDFEALRTTQGWVRSSLHEIDTLSVAPSAVVFRLTFQRHNAAGESYWTTPALWIVTEQDGHWGIQVRSLHLRAFEEPSARGEAETAAEAALRSYFSSWNAEDNDGLRRHMNFPFVSFFRSELRLALTPEASTTDFDALRSAGWARSEIESIDVLSSSADKVHLRCVFSRRRADGSVMMRARTLYIMTLRGDHWGIQLRTALPTR